MQISGITNLAVICKPRWCFDMLTWTMWQDHRDLRGKRELYLWDIMWKRLEMEHEAGRPLRWLIGRPWFQRKFAEGWMPWKELCKLAAKAVPGLKGNPKPYRSEWIAMYDFDDPDYLDPSLWQRTKDKLKKIKKRPGEIVLFHPELTLPPTEEELRAQALEKERAEREHAEQRRLRAVEQQTEKLAALAGTQANVSQAIDWLDNLEYASRGQVVNFLWRRVAREHGWHADDDAEMCRYRSAHRNQVLDLSPPAPEAVQRAIDAGKAVVFRKKESAAG
jgi:hypothetical protein